MKRTQVGTNGMLAVGREEAPKTGVEGCGGRSALEVTPRSPIFRSRPCQVGGRREDMTPD